jgi:hypothetical protein
MFYDHTSCKGKCPFTGMGHEAQGYNFSISHDLEGRQNYLQKTMSQPEWRQCTVCFGLFFNGYNLKGACPGRTQPSGHIASDRHNYFLWHDTAVEWDDPPIDVPGPYTP